MSDADTVFLEKEIAVLQIKNERQDREICRLRHAMKKAYQKLNDHPGPEYPIALVMAQCILREELHEIR